MLQLPMPFLLFVKLAYWIDKAYYPAGWKYAYLSTKMLRLVFAMLTFDPAIFPYLFNLMHMEYRLTSWNISPCPYVPPTTTLWRWVVIMTLLHSPLTWWSRPLTFHLKRNPTTTWPRRSITASAIHSVPPSALSAFTLWSRHMTASRLLMAFSSSSTFFWPCTKGTRISLRLLLLWFDDELPCDRRPELLLDWLSWTSGEW